jgi:hypothetical protein
MSSLWRYVSKNLHYLVPLPILFGALLAWVYEPAALVQFRLQVFDEFLRLKPRVYEPTPVRIVDIDDASLQEFGQWPWPRTLLAKLVARLDQMGAAAILPTRSGRAISCLASRCAASPSIGCRSSSRGSRMPAMTRNPGSRISAAP